MKHGKKLLCMLLALALLASMSVTALAEDVTVEEESPKLTVKCVDAEGSTLRDKEEDYIDLSKDVTVDDKYTRPEIENYTYSKTTLDGEELTKLTVTHDAEGKAVITATFGEGEDAKEKTLTGSETLLFVYEKKAEEHTHVWDEGKVTKEATCEEKGEKTFTCSCGETKTEEIPALGHEWDEGKVTKEASCTEKGEKTFTCKHDSKHTKTEDIAALGHDYAHGRCKRCDGIDPAFKPKLTDKSSGKANWGSNYVVTSDAAKKDFQQVLVDGKELATSDYKVEEKDGNTQVTITGAAVKKLKVGEHTVSVVSATGTAEKKFNVSDKPKTGDTDLTLWVGLLALSALGCGAAVFTMKKKFSAR